MGYTSLDTSTIFQTFRDLKFFISFINVLDPLFWISSWHIYLFNLYAAHTTRRSLGGPQNICGAHIWSPQKGTKELTYMNATFLMFFLNSPLCHLTYSRPSKFCIPLSFKNVLLGMGEGEAWKLLQISILNLTHFVSTHFSIYIRYVQSKKGLNPAAFLKIQLIQSRSTVRVVDW